MKRRIIPFLALLVVAAVFAIPALAATKNVKIGDNYFVRAKGVPTVTAKVGDTVKWKWTGHAPHNVTVKSGPAKFHSATQTSGTFAQKITKPGTYVIYCTIHGAKDQSMKLVVKK